jgi:DNA-binding LytR/AlgR family response regulator
MTEFRGSEFQTQPDAAPCLPVGIDDERSIANVAIGRRIKPAQRVGSTHGNGELATSLVPKGRTPEAKELFPQRQEAHNWKRARIAVRSKGEILLFDPIELVVVQAQGNYVLLQRQDCSHLLRGSISAMADKLEPYGFIRIHRSVLVNASHVEEVRALMTGGYDLHLRSGKTYTVSRRYRQNLRLLAELWIGADP